LFDFFVKQACILRPGHAALLTGRNASQNTPSRLHKPPNFGELRRNPSR